MLRYMNAADLCTTKWLDLALHSYSLEWKIITAWDSTQIYLIGTNVQRYLIK